MSASCIAVSRECINWHFIPLLLTIMQFSTMSDHRKARLSGSCSRSVRSSVTKPDSPNPEERSGCALDDAKHWRPGSRLRKFPFMLRGIAPGTTVHELRQFLGQAGTIKDIYIPVHHINRTPRYGHHSVG